MLADPLWDATVAGDASRESRGPAARAFFPQLGSLGSGSDYTVFLDHLAVPSVDVGFHGGYGVYHSIYDDFHWMEKFGDPEFLTHATAARLYTLIVMRAAAAEIAPFKFVPYAAALREHVDELRLIHLRRMRKSRFRKDRHRARVPGNLPPLSRPFAHFMTQAEELDRATAAIAECDQVDRTNLARLNDLLSQVERAFLLEKGLPDRPWFKHAIYAPGLTTGYAAWPLPAIRQALEDKNNARLAIDVAMTVERIKQGDRRHGVRQQAMARTVLGTP